MATTSRIEWTEMTWNPVTGCDKVSAGCKYCYAETMARRLLAMGQPRYANGFKVTLQEDLVDLPLRWHQPRTVFVNSMSDLFHDEIPEAFIRRVFETMVKAEQHTFQVLTKRAARLADLAPRLPWPNNVWMGVSVENRAQTARVRHLREVEAAVRKRLYREAVVLKVGGGDRKAAHPHPGHHHGDEPGAEDRGHQHFGG